MQGYFAIQGYPKTKMYIKDIAKHTQFIFIQSINNIGDMIKR